MPYEPSRYWGQLHDRRDLSAVGQSGLPSEMNLWLYRTLARNMRHFLRRNGCEQITGKVFEAGAGTGYWVKFWLKLGAEGVDGCDLVPAAVTDLNNRFASTGRFHVADIGRSDGLQFGTYKLVSCINVLLHLTDDDKFETALANIARLVEPGGRLLLTEPILFNASFEPAYDPERHSRARSWKRYRDGLEREGLKLNAIAAGTVIGNNPIEGRWRWIYRAWRGAWGATSIPSRIHSVNARWVGPILYGLDPILLAAGAAPSSKFALFTRPGQAVRSPLT